MKEYMNPQRVVFKAFNYLLLTALAVLYLLPLVNILAISFSSSVPANAGEVTFWPVEFTFRSYTTVFERGQFYASLLVSLERVVLGCFVNMSLALLTAYPLSKENKSFRFRTVYAWFFVFTMLFHGGLIPWYLTVKMTGLIDSIWALILPGAVQVFNIVLLLNFFRQLPKALEDAAFIDGAGHLRILLSIYIPLSTPAMATIGLFMFVGHWNSWFDGLILISKPNNLPFQSYLQTLVVSGSSQIMSTFDLVQMQKVSERTIKAALIFIGCLPIISVYPFLQRYFVKGIVLGSVKE
jgi:putative aldouronate transport system permease protein